MSHWSIFYPFKTPIFTYTCFMFMCVHAHVCMFMFVCAGACTCSYSFMLHYSVLFMRMLCMDCLLLFFSFSKQALNFLAQASLNSLCCPMVLELTSLRWSSCPNSYLLALQGWAIMLLYTNLPVNCHRILLGKY